MYLINSPVVRAEPLKFTETGVKGVVRDVMIPWYVFYKNRRVDEHLGWSMVVAWHICLA
jgi:hypothetical protein